ncbi:MAG: translation initiation factor IF-3 [Bradymonadales bacterium]|nr:translation initiation factor IF-3 [Bradymonadales bacterium]
MTDKPQPPSHRINHQIRFPQIRVIGPDGSQLGIMTPDEGRRMAEESGLDLVEVAAAARPPVCRIMDFGKFRYDQSKKKDHSKQVVVKTITLRPKTDDHDLATKLSQTTKFLEKGNKVRFVMRMRGREHAHADLWINKLRDIIDRLPPGTYTVSLTARLEGRNIVAMVDPI